MAVFAECPTCRRKNPAANSHCRCGAKMPSTDRVYWIVYRPRPGGGTKAKRLGRITLREARETEIRLLEEAAAEPPPPVESPKTWKEIRYAYVQKLASEGRNEMYQADTHHRLRKMAEFWGDDLPATELTPMRIKEFRITLLDDDLARATCDRYLAAGKAAWNYSVEDLPNPFNRVKLFRPDNERIRYLTTEQRARLLDCALKVSRKLWEMILVSIATGFRRGQILKLRRDEVDLDAGVVRVRQKGDRGHAIPLGRAVTKVLADIPDNGTPYFWISDRTGEPHSEALRKSWKRALECAELQGLDLHWHDLRHDTGSAVYAATGDLHAVQKYLGHSQIRTTQRYAHMMPDHLRSAAAAVDALLTKSVDLEEEDEKKQGGPGTSNP